jgi:hypothetical protein
MTHIWLVTLAVCCGSPSVHPGSPATNAIAAGDASSPTATAGQQPSKLRSPPGDQVWPTRVCAANHALVFENSCGCGEVLQCEVRSAIAPTLEVVLRKDPSSGGMCTDCTAMVPARCALPTLRAGVWTVRLTGSDAFELVANAAGLVVDRCWEEWMPGAR